MHVQKYFIYRLRWGKGKSKNSCQGFLFNANLRQGFFRWGIIVWDICTASLGTVSSFSFWASSWKLWAFRRPALFLPLPTIQHWLPPEVAAGSVTRKQLGAIVSGEGKALDKAEFKVDYNKSLSPWASVPHLPLLQMTAETKAPEPGVWAEFSSHNYTADVWGRATVSAVGDSLCSCTKTHHLQTC